MILPRRTPRPTPPRPRTPSANRPSSGSATAASGVEKFAWDASGQTTSRAPASAAARAASRMRLRFAPGSSVEENWAAATLRLVLFMAVLRVLAFVVYMRCDPGIGA